MADNDSWSGYLRGISNWFADPKNDSTTYIPSTPLTQYPTPEDAKSADQAGLSYGTGNEAFSSGQVANIIGSEGHKIKIVKEGKTSKAIAEPTGFVTDSAFNHSLSTDSVNDWAKANSKLVELNDPKNSTISEGVGTAFAQAQEAVTRNPIAALGYDPHAITLDLAQGKTNLSGVTQGKDIWSTLSEPSTIVHESTHRGLNILAENSPEAKTILKQITQEPLVRYLMATKAGDPEGKDGDIDAKQRQQGLDLYQTDFASKARQKHLQRLEELAQEMIKDRKPHGPN